MLTSWEVSIMLITMTSIGVNMKKILVDLKQEEFTQIKAKAVLENKTQALYLAELIRLGQKARDEKKLAP